MSVQKKKKKRKIIVTIKTLVFFFFFTFIGFETLCLSLDSHKHVSHLC